jgi:hypothetical protein
VNNIGLSVPCTNVESTYVTVSVDYRKGMYHKVLLFSGTANTSGSLMCNITLNSIYILLSMFEVATLLAIGIYYTSSCKSNHDHDSS